jgi:hypothetical protein
MISDEELLAQVVREMAAREAPLTLVLKPSTVLNLVALLQLALRHPDIDDAAPESGYVARVLLEHARGFFADAPAIRELIRRGDDPRYDVPRRPV